MWFHRRIGILQKIQKKLRRFEGEKNCQSRQRKQVKRGWSGVVDSSEANKIDYVSLNLLRKSIVESMANVNRIWDNNSLRKSIVESMANVNVNGVDLSSFKFHLHWLLRNGNYYIQL